MSDKNDNNYDYEWELEYYGKKAEMAKKKLHYGKQVERARKKVQLLSLGIFVELRDKFLEADRNATPNSVTEFLKGVELSQEILNSAIIERDADKKRYDEITEE